MIWVLFDQPSPAFFGCDASFCRCNAVFGFFPWHRPPGQVWTLHGLFADIYQNYLEHHITGLECLFCQAVETFSSVPKRLPPCGWYGKPWLHSHHRIVQYEILSDILVSTSRSATTDRLGSILAVSRSLAALFR
jgi:hypothetical protein